jgi:two-component system, cell cycle sensor histidine kinase and response regulator CckA
MLAQGGYRCLEAADGTEAVQLLEAGDPVHLILTDVIMPNMGGEELARHAAAARPDLRVIFMSGHTNNPVVKNGDSPSFLAKPFTFAAVLEKVAQVLEKPWP